MGPALGASQSLSLSHGIECGARSANRPFQRKLDVENTLPEARSFRKFVVLRNWASHAAASTGTIRRMLA